jgi:hypothetical protein
MSKFITTEVTDYTYITKAEELQNLYSAVRIPPSLQYFRYEFAHFSLFVLQLM